MYPIFVVRLALRICRSARQLNNGYRRAKLSYCKIVLKRESVCVKVSHYVWIGAVRQ